MRKGKSVIIAASIATVITGCSKNEENNPEQVEKLKKSSIVGRYDCRMENEALAKLISVDLREKGRAYTKSKALGVSNETVGTYERDGDRLIITVDGKATVFNISANLISLNQSGIKAKCYKEESAEEKNQRLSSLFGTYVLDPSNSEGVDFRLSLKENGNGQITKDQETSKIMYRVESDKLILSREDEAKDWVFTILGKKLVAKIPGSDGTATLTKE